MTIIELMLFMNHQNEYLYYHKDTHSFDEILGTSVEEGMKLLESRLKKGEQDESI